MKTFNEIRENVIENGVTYENVVALYNYAKATIKEVKTEFNAVKEKALKGAITEDDINVIVNYKNVISYNKSIVSMTRFTAIKGEEYFNDKFNVVKESVEKYWGSF